MSKAAKQSIIILIILLVFTLAFTGFSLMEKRQLLVQKNNLQGQIAQLERESQQYLAQVQELKKKEAGYVEQIQSLEGEAATFDEQKSDLEQQIQALQDQSDAYSIQLAEVQTTREKWENRLESITKERDNLIQELKKKGEPQIVYKEVVKEVPVRVPSPVKQNDTSSYEPTDVPDGNEEYWASVLRKKASLEVEIQTLKDELAENSIEVVDLTQKNANLQLELEDLKKGQTSLERDRKYKQDMINNLSLELARARNDRKFVSNQIESLNQENNSLRKQMKQLIAAKTALEKTVVKMRQEKESMEQKIAQSDGIIQSKIDEIWDIKDSIDQTFKSTRLAPGDGSIELPPIVVNNTKDIDPLNPDLESPGYNGRVLSVNDNNNFIIVNIGETQGVQIGETLTVYHGSEYIARVEVIQIRKDIAAADIKEQSSPVSVGDIVR